MNTKNVIVTPNYLDRKHPLRWMIKEHAKGLPTCYDKLVLKGLCRTQNTGGEGFGCSVGIIAKEATDFFNHATLSSYTRLHFDGRYNFQKFTPDPLAQKKEPVVNIEDFSEVVLLSDGSFYGKV